MARYSEVFCSMRLSCFSIQIALLGVQLWADRWYWMTRNVIYTYLAILAEVIILTIWFKLCPALFLNQKDELDALMDFFFNVCSSLNDVSCLGYKYIKMVSRIRQEVCLAYPDKEFSASRTQSHCLRKRQHYATGFSSYTNIPGNLVTGIFLCRDNASNSAQEISLLSWVLSGNSWGNISPHRYC